MTYHALIAQMLEALELHAKQYPHMQKGYTVDAIAAAREYLAAGSKPTLTGKLAKLGVNLRSEFEPKHSDADMPETTAHNLRNLVEGMAVSIDVSTGEHDSGNRLFGVVNEVMGSCSGEKHGLTLLVYETTPNFKSSQTPTYDIDQAVNRFLGWRLPVDFFPDSGINFVPFRHSAAWPIGTNLFTADQARAMFEYCISKTNVKENDQ